MTRPSIILILLLLLIPAAAASASVTISPATIDPGDTVTVDVRGLPDNATFSLSISAEFDVTAGDTFSFAARDLTLPFSLSQGRMNAYTKGTDWTELSAPLPDGGSATLRYYADKNGELWITQSADSISSGTYGAITLSGEAVADTIIADMTVTGTKKGQDDGTISFALGGVEHGTATVAVFIDGSEVLSQKIAIGTPTSSGGNGGTDGTGGSSSPGGTGSSPSATPSPPSVVTSADGKASLTGTGIESAKILSSAVEGTLPTGWTTDGRTYSITPADRALDAVISFPAPNTTATIARLEDGAWSLIPSKIEGDRITAKVTRGGSYAVLVLAEVPTQMVTTPTTTAPATTTPAAPTPLAPLIPVAACAILILVQGRKD